MCNFILFNNVIKTLIESVRSINHTHLHGYIAFLMNHNKTKITALRYATLIFFNLLITLSLIKLEIPIPIYKIKKHRC